MDNCRLGYSSPYNRNLGKSFKRLIHYAPLMMSQKVAPRKHTCVLSKKVGCLMLVSNYLLIGDNGCFLGATFHYILSIST